MRIVLFLGYSGSGKTTAITTLVRALKRHGKRVATIKHVHHTGFTIDTPGKDTWLHAAAGASIVVSIAPKELTVIRKEETTKMELDDVIDILRREKASYVLVEGLYRRLSNRRGIIRVLCVSSERDAESFLRKQSKPNFIAGKLARGRSGETFYDIPLIDFPKDTMKFLNIIG